MSTGPLEVIPELKLLDNKTAELTAPMSFIDTYQKLFDILNESFYLCKTARTEPYELIVSFNQVHKYSTRILLVLRTLFVLVKNYNGDVNRVWEVGIQNFIENENLLTEYANEPVGQTIIHQSIKTLINHELVEKLEYPDYVNSSAKMLEQGLISLRKIENTLDNDGFIMKLIRFDARKNINIFIIRLEKMNYDFRLLLEKNRYLKKEINAFIALEKAPEDSYAETALMITALQDNLKLIYAIYLELKKEDEFITHLEAFIL